MNLDSGAQRRTASAPHLRPQLEDSKAGGGTPLKAHSLTIWRLTLVLAETLPGVLPRDLSMWPGLPLTMMAGFQRCVSQEREQARWSCILFMIQSWISSALQIRGITSPCPPSRGENHKPNHGWERTCPLVKTWNWVFMGMPILGKRNLPHRPFLIQINSPQPWPESWCSVLMTFVCKAQTQNWFWFARVFTTSLGKWQHSWSTTSSTKTRAPWWEPFSYM